MSDQFDEMFQQFKSLDELKMFSQAQGKTIIEQSKKINKLEEEIKNLKTQLESSKIVESNPVSSDLNAGSDQEIIAKIQLNKLKEKCFDRELTLDEVKRAEILVKILNSDKKSHKQEAKEEPISSNQLLEMLDKINTVS